MTRSLHPRHRLRAGRGVALADGRLGQTITARASALFRHPWQTVPVFAAGAWYCTVAPGFVNAACPLVTTTVAEQKTDGRDFGKNPLTGKPFFSDPIFASSTPSSSGSKTANIPLYLSPAIPLSFRALGFDGSGAVPQFFLDRGAARSPALPDAEAIIAAGGEASSGFTVDTAPPHGLRLLRACDIILHQPRNALTSSIAIAPGLVTGLSNVTQTLGITGPKNGDFLRVFPGTFQAIDNSGINPLAGDFTEEPWDELLISTVFLLSPPGTAPGSDPDGTWTPYVRHNLFWNLNYRQPVLRALGGSELVPEIPAPFGGAAQIVVNYLNAAINDAAQQTFNLIVGHSLAGTFWTPTGGGHSSTFPPVGEESAAGTTALDKDARLAAQRQAAAAAKRAEKLDADFPYSAMPFDPGSSTLS